ncbi:MAG TPA: YihY/virulence factor BrkB family protein [Myxococcota bacterium]|nr:YihY/virulence factor BrkB family protein [Myxococcota bacterium]
MRWVQLVRETVVEWWRVDALRHGAALAYYSVFSLAPILVISVALAGLVFGEEAARGHIVGEIGGLVGEDGAEAIQTLIEKASLQEDTGLAASLIGVATLLFGATAAFGQLQYALNRIWDVRENARSGWKGLVRARFVSFSMVLVIGFLLLTSLVVTAALAALDQLVGTRIEYLQPILNALNTVVSLGVITCLFAAIFKVLPDTRIAWRDVWLGAAVTALLFVVGKTVIGLYIGNTSVASTYGAASSVVVLLLWIYYSAQIVFLGAEFTHVVARRRGAADSPRGEIAQARETISPRRASV